MPDDVLQSATSVVGHTIRTVAGHPGRARRGRATRNYESTNITEKTAVVVYREEPDGFVITAFFTSKPEKIERKGPQLWPKPPSQTS